MNTIINNHPNHNIKSNAPFKKAYARFPIAYKVSLAFAAVSVLTLSVMWSIVSSNLKGLMLDLSDTVGQSLASQTANASAELILAEDLLSLNVVIAEVTKAPMINGAAIINTENKLLAHAGEMDFSDELTRLNQSSPPSLLTQGLYVAPITFQDIVAGYALIHLDKTLITSNINQSLKWMSLATFCILCISIIFALILGKHITGPIKHLTLGTNALHEGNLDYRITEKRQDELGSLINRFNEMAQGMKERQQLTQTFHRYLDRNIANNLLANLDNPTIPTQYVNASVLFVDIVGFTSMCEQLAPEEVGNLLNTYYHHTLKASSIFNGTVDKFIGDGVMIIFGAPQNDEQHCFNAVCCAQLLLGLVNSYNQTRKENNLPTIQFRLGIHSGEMLAGTLGSDERMQYTVVGDTVNLAARLCGLAPPGKLVISDAVYQGAEGGSRLITQDQKLLKVRGKSSEIPTYTVNALKQPYAKKIMSHVESIDHTMSRKHINAKDNEPV